MTNLNNIMVDCPECGEEIEVPWGTESFLEEGRMHVILTPDRVVLAEHFVKCQSADDQTSE